MAGPTGAAARTARRGHGRSLDARDASGGAAREVALPVVADSGRWRWVTGAGDGRTGHGGDGLEVEVERREEEARALMRLGAPDHGFGGSGASPDWDEDGGGERVRGSGTSRDRARRYGGAGRRAKGDEIERSRARVRCWGLGGLGLRGRPAGLWRSGAADGAGLAWLLGCRAPFSLSISNSLIKTENKEKEKGKKRKVRERVGHGDNFHGLVKMCTVHEK